MPRFSVIVPAHQVQAYLHECLDSVLGQCFGDLELIAVDDCSPDSSGEILDAYAAADPRVTVIHLAENIGLGPARNTGTARARGDYVLYLDSDDTMAPGALRALAERLSETSDPDILLFDFAPAYWDGSLGPPAHPELLAPRAGPGVCTLDERPELLRLTAVAWNKAYRRAFLLRERLAFPPGTYEDTPWTFPALLTARALGTLDRVCVHYRQRRGGSILTTTGRRHFDVFDQYDRLFAFVATRPGLDRWHHLLHQRMTDHFATIHSTPGRLPGSARAEFLHRARAHCRRHRPAPAAERPAAPPGRRLRRLLVRHGAHHAFRLLAHTGRARRLLGARLRGARRVLRKALLRGHYLLQRRRPLDPRLAVFSAYWDRGYSCHPAAIEAKARELVPDIRTAWICSPDHAHTLPPGVRRLRPGSAAYWTALARARFLVSNVNLPHSYRKRPGQLLLQTHHGTPLKHMGLDLMAYPAAADGMDFGRLLEHTDRWDFSLSGNPHSTLVWERAYPSPYTTLEFGHPRNDVLQTATAADVARLRTALGIPDRVTAVLYAPTHRDHQPGRQPWLDLARLVATLGPSFVVLARAHYFHTGQGLPCEPPGGLLDVSAHPSVEELFLASDVLVTDYSSLMFDYANLDRPLVVHAPDWETYRDTRGTYFDVTAAAPGPVARSEDELIDILATGAHATEHARALRAAFRQRFCPWDDGHAAERVVRHVFLGTGTGTGTGPGRGTGSAAAPPGAAVPAAVPPLVPLAERRPAPAPGSGGGSGPGAAPRTPLAPPAAKDWWSCPASASSYRCSRSRATCASASTRCSASPSPTWR
ncbi:bifunctional glycosyltransferase family 2 protein/CDP-glycerol:glycerophosphate glycerophosphotransferase [Streptomyces sp. WMMB303]|uniref:bifunctional glycosyltransferase/CDP-glycerol:glycerophosphate glycerophosphotransferase n=1 Tax=Streptomyces sp. WMMB303 TaxID=3034154 RepID=UPI0023ED7AD6|nr:bifunctional glycosyltransferase family 2 protein/CDP-glycerol:glycerophosphate glycerophosphotransferase [Streptomyces sp. WMMB303]MDF4250972.1 bifunctional glycosyltransferase family 2 protein/CDP-glycerol:glycerophosphate glycerophosphotransferase [Streptomyces sp. WMMB303]